MEGREEYWAQWRPTALYRRFPRRPRSPLPSNAALFLLLLLLASEGLPAIRAARYRRRVFTNEWAVRVAGGDENEANSIAARHGFTNLGRIMEDYFLFGTRRLRKRSTRRSRSVGMELSTEPHVAWMEQQVAKKRVKRGYVDPNAADHLLLKRPPQPEDAKPNDPLWPDMWYLNRGGSGLDHNVAEAWSMGLTGKGIVVTILDDGLERSHPDIAPNYDPLASYDINDQDPDPSPRYDISNENRHGTRCAGEVAAVFNNTLCIVGIAFNAHIGGIRMLDGDVTDAVEAASLSHNRDHIDIYSASWGPDDDGRTVDGPARLARLAFEHGIQTVHNTASLQCHHGLEEEGVGLEGRAGKGSIFVWASGNGGRDADSCNCDGYTNAVQTLSISSATEHGNVPWYSEACSSTLATTYSSGSHGERMIVTTDLHHSCTQAHTGTSASAPLAAGIVALTLEANPWLTWRDLQHVVRTARPERLRAPDWVRNGVGRNVSHSFGFGLMDAAAMVRLARNWTTVPDQQRCLATYPGRYKAIPHGSRLHISLNADGCGGAVRFLEHVQARVTLTAPKRGDLQMFLTSPSGTRSTLLAKRARDLSRAGFRDWAFMTTHNWGERAAGTWHLEIDNDGWTGIGRNDADASLLTWDLILYGTAEEIGPMGKVVASTTGASTSAALNGALVALLLPPLLAALLS